MNSIRVILDVDKDPPIYNLDPANTVQIKKGIVFSRIPAGMQSGRSAVGITAPLPDGRYLFLELSMANFEMAAAAFRGAEQRQAEAQ